MTPYQFSVITIMPELFEPFARTGVFGRAVAAGLLELDLINPRDFTNDVHRTVDDEPFGGGAGMVFKPQPLYHAIKTAGKRNAGPVIYLSPAGRKLDHEQVMRLSSLDGVTLLCGRYEGVDQRIIDHFVDEEISIGDYVLSGGEPAALVFMDAVARQREGVVKEKASVEHDSFYDGLLDHPHYTRPARFDGESVPDVLLSGDHKRIHEWRQKMKLVQTLTRRPDLLETADLTPEQKKWLIEIRNGLKQLL